jgi:hypothetical protein
MARQEEMEKYSPEFIADIIARKGETIRQFKEDITELKEILTLRVLNVKIGDWLKKVEGAQQGVYKIEGATSRVHRGKVSELGLFCRLKKVDGTMSQYRRSFITDEDLSQFERCGGMK